MSQARRTFNSPEQLELICALAAAVYGRNYADCEVALIGTLATIIVEQPPEEWQDLVDRVTKVIAQTVAAAAPTVGSA